MSFSFKSLAGTKKDIAGHNDVKDGNPAGGYVTEGYYNPADGSLPRFYIRWQDGPLDRDVAFPNPNGAFVEDVLQACVVRLEFYQESEFACDENAEAIQKISEGIEALTRRRKDRQERGVEGKHEK